MLQGSWFNSASVLDPSISPNAKATSARPLRFVRLVRLLFLACMGADLFALWRCSLLIGVLSLGASMFIASRSIRLTTPCGNAVSVSFIHTMAFLTLSQSILPM